MSYLLDTHALLWWLADDPALPPGVREVIANPDNQLFVSASTAWEISIKKGLGKLEAPDNLAELLEEEGFEELPITFRHGELAGSLPAVHRDPFDRMLIAQSQILDLTILTRDGDISQYEVTTYWS